MRRHLLYIFLFFCTSLHATQILIPMDNTQKNHLKAYGITYWVLESEVEIYWLLNYRGGSFMTKHIPQIEEELIIRGVSYEVIADAMSTAILSEIADPEVNMDALKMEKAPNITKIAQVEKEKRKRVKMSLTLSPKLSPTLSPSASQNARSREVHTVPARVGVGFRLKPRLRLSLRCVVRL